MLKGKVALVTGASRGIGRQIALTLADYGAVVIVNYNGSKEKAEEVVSLIQEKGGTAEAVQCSVADYAACGDMITQMLGKYGHIDILVNNAGITRDMLLMRMSEEQFDQVINTNLKGTFNMVRHASSLMLKQRSGTIINMASVVGVTGNIGQANYAASKAGIIGLTKSAAKELAQRGITCNAIAPGFVETDMTDVLAEETKQEMLKAIPLKRYGTVDDIASAAVFLAKNTYITGQVLNVDGGMVM